MAVKFTVTDLRLDMYGDKKPFVAFHTKCECGKQFDIRDHNNFCGNCGKPLPRFDSNHIDSNSLYLTELIDMENLRSYLEDWLEEFMLPEVTNGSSTTNN